MLQNARVAGITVSELLSKNQDAPPRLGSKIVLFDSDGAESNNISNMLYGKYHVYTVNNILKSLKTEMKCHYKSLIITFTF